LFNPNFPKVKLSFEILGTFWVSGKFPPFFKPGRVPPLNRKVFGGSPFQIINFSFKGEEILPFGRPFRVSPAKILFLGGANLTPFSGCKDKPPPFKGEGFNPPFKGFQNILVRIFFRKGALLKKFFPGENPHFSCGTLYGGRRNPLSKI